MVGSPVHPAIMMTHTSVHGVPAPTPTKHQNGFTLLPQHQVDDDDTTSVNIELSTPHPKRSNSIISLQITSVLPPVIRPRNSYAGIIMVAVSALMFSLMSLFVSLAAIEQSISSFEILIVRCIMQTSFSLMACMAQRINPFGQSGYRGLLCMRGLVGIVSMSCLYYSVTALGVADATVLFFISPIFAGLAGRLLLNEEWTFFDNCCAIGSVIGCVLVARPSFIFHEENNDINRIDDGHSRTFGVAVALTGSFLTAMVFILIRRIGTGAKSQVLVFYTGAAGLIYGPVMLLFQHYTPVTEWNMWTTIYLFSVGMCAFAGQTLFNRGVQLEKAGVASMTRNLDVVFVFVWQISILQQPINTLSIVGAAVMTASVCAIGVKKVLSARATEKDGNNSQTT